MTNRVRWRWIAAHRSLPRLLGMVLLLALSSSNVALARPEGKLPVSIPIEVADNLVYAQGRINHSRPLSVVLDTGSSLSIVAPAIARQIGLHPSGAGEAAGIGHGSSQHLQFVEGARLQLGPRNSGLKVDGQRIAILPIGYVAEAVGRPTDSFFGSNIFNNYRVTVDYEDQKATFAAPASPLLAGSTKTVPIKLLNDTPFVTATLVGADGFRVEGLFLLDSGTTASLVLSKRFVSAHPEIIAGRAEFAVPPVEAVGGTIGLKLVRIAALDLGPFHFSEPVASIPEDVAGVLANPEIAGFIGAEILCRFTVTWDYPHKRILLAPNLHLTDAFEADASGLRLTVSPPDYKTIHVAAVLAGSPAAQSGLRPGDLVASVNGKRGMPLWQEVNELRKPGTSPILTIRRDSKNIRVMLHLRRLV